MNKLLFNLFVLIITLAMISCSSSNTAGGSDLPNGKITVSIEMPESLNMNVNCSLKSVKITSSGEKILYFDSKYLLASDNLEFVNVPPGNYIITAMSEDSLYGAINSKISVDEDSIVENIALKTIVNLKGRALNSNAGSVLVPGLNKQTAIDSLGFYTIDKCLLGEFEICFIENGLLNIVSLKTKEQKEIDTLFIQDIKVVDSLINIDEQYQLYETDLSASVYVNPQIYDFENKPAWYEEKDFSNVTYLKVDTIENTQVEVWHFPIIAGVTQQTSDYYGGFDSVKDSIKNHIKKLDSLFNIDGLKGDIRYTLDSVYLISMHPDSEVIEPPAGFAVRVLYDGYGEGTKGNWIKNKRVIVHNSSAENTGSFSDAAMKSFMWEFGLSRGGTYISSAEIYSSENKVNCTAFNAPATVMNLKSTTEWIDVNIHLMNYYGANFSIVPSIVLSSYPDTIGIEIVDYDNKPIEGIQINVYGLESFGDSLDTIIDFSGLTKANGRWVLDNNPFVNDTQTGFLFDNLLIEVYDGNNKVYSWLPYYKVIEWWFEHPGESFYLKVNLL